MTASHTTTDDARIPDHCGWAARGYWREAYDDAVAALRQVTAERDAWKEGAGAHHVASMQQAQRADRAEVAETEVATLRAKVEALGRDLNRALYGEPHFGWEMHKDAMSDLRARAEAAEAEVARLTEAQKEASEAWPAVLALIREYDEAFPYAEGESDDAIVTRMNKAVSALNGGKTDD